MRRILLSIFSHRTLALLRWDIHFLKVRITNNLLFRKRRLNFFLKRPSDKKFLNLGSGPRGIDKNEWVNIDGFKYNNVHYVCDFNRKLPFNNETFDGIFCEHVLEHFTWDDGMKLMKECCRILKKEGIIRIIIPDGKKFMKAYFDNPNFLISYKQCYTNYAMEAVNAWFYQRYEHQCMYDSEYLKAMLLSAGFIEAKQVGFNMEAFGNRHIILDDEKYSWESLYMEAVK